MGENHGGSVRQFNAVRPERRHTTPDDTTTFSPIDVSMAAPPDSGPTGGLADEIVLLSQRLASGTFELLRLVAQADHQGIWAADGAISCVAWLAELCGVEASTARNQVRVAKAMREHPGLYHAMANGDLSFSKARILVAHLDHDNAPYLIELAADTPIRYLARAIAAWSNRNEDHNTIEERQHQARSLTWRTDPDGMITLTARLQPATAGKLCAAIDQHVMTNNAPVGTTLAQQRADALSTITTTGGTNIDTELVIHVRADGNTMSDGTPDTRQDNTVASLLPNAFISLLVHDSQRQPIDASPRRRTPTRRQRRLIDQLHPQCNSLGCTATTLLQYDHKTPYSHQGLTTIDNLQRLCGPHNRKKGTDTTPQT